MDFHVNLITYNKDLQVIIILSKYVTQLKIIKKKKFNFALYLLNMTHKIR